MRFMFHLSRSIFQLCGIALIAVGVGFLLKYDEVLDAFRDVNVNVAPIAFIVIGSAIFLIAFFGCCGAIFESECMVSTVCIFTTTFTKTQNFNPSKKKLCFFNNHTKHIKHIHTTHWISCFPYYFQVERFKRLYLRLFFFLYSWNLVQFLKIRKSIEIHEYTVNI